MNTPWMLITGASLIGFVFPDFLYILGNGRVRPPIGENILCAIAFGLVAASFV